MTLRKNPSDWTDDNVRRFWDYQATHEHRLQLYFSRILARSLTKFLQLLGEVRGNVLDFGCGPGYLTEVLCGFPANVFAADSSTRSLAETNARCARYSNFQGAIQTEGMPSPFTEGQFDFITLIETVEHLPPHALNVYLRELFRILRPGGLLMITTPHNENLDAGLIYCPFCDVEFHYMQHFQSFTAPGFAELLQSLGYHVEFCQGIELGELDDVQPHSTAAHFGWKLKRKLRFGLARLRNRLTSRSIAARLRSICYPGPHLVAIVAKPA